MAKSRFEYVKQFERENYLVPETWVVVRVDGRGFHKFSKFYEFDKPNDEKALNLMNQTAKKVMEKITEVFLAYGDSDEYSFVLDKNCALFDRRESKIVSTFASTFSAYYQRLWGQFFPDKPLDLDHLPTFDARAVIYPNNHTLRDYLAWRQADCHINNLYNTAFWALVLKGGLSPQDAEQELCGTVSSDKNEILFSRFGINYNDEKEMFKKGTVLVRVSQSHNEATDEKEQSPGRVVPLTKRQQDRERARRRKAEIQILHVDIIGDQFWQQRSWLLA